MVDKNERYLLSLMILCVWYYHRVLEYQFPNFYITDYFIPGFIHMTKGDKNIIVIHHFVVQLHYTYDYALFYFIFDLA